MSPLLLLGWAMAAEFNTTSFIPPEISLALIFKSSCMVNALGDIMIRYQMRKIREIGLYQEENRRKTCCGDPPKKVIVRRLERG